MIGGGFMWVEIFKTGKHKDSKGREEEYKEETLEKIANIYNSKVQQDNSYEAPVVLGHPKNNEPAFGWVERLKRSGEKLLAKLKDLSDEFIKELKDKRYRKVSMSIYPDLMLRHIGFLGAAQPAIKGLKPIIFDSNSEFLEYGSQETDESDVIEFFALEQRIKELQEQNAQLEKENEIMLNELELVKKNARAKNFEEYYSNIIDECEGLWNSPAQKEKFVEIMELAYNYENGIRFGKDFNEGKSFVDLVKDFFKLSLTNDIFKEYTQKSNFAGADLDYDFSDKNVIEGRMNIHNYALKIIKDKPELSYEEAVMIATMDNS